METTQKTDNEIIAEFMGLEPKRIGTISSEISSTPVIDWGYEVPFKTYPAIPPFDTSWDWLMPVVEKIESTQYKKYLYEIKGYTFIINGRCAEVVDIEGEAIVKQQVGESKLKATYKAVVLFIHWYNQQVKP
jgi:hypothetical protein